MEDDEAMEDDEYMAVLRRTGDLVTKAFGEVGKGRRNDEVARTADAALVELVAVEFRGDGARMADRYLDRPEHLPADDKDLLAIYNATSVRDRALKADLMEWVKLNEGVTRTNAHRCVVPLKAILLASEIIVDPKTPEDLRQLVHGWKKEIALHLRIEFSIDYIKAPRDPNQIEGWCMEEMRDRDPSLAWALVSDRTRRMFRPIASASDVADRAERGTDDDGEE